MKEVGIKNIIYSGTNGEILKQRFRDYVPKVYTLGRQFILNGYTAIYRDSGIKRTINYEQNTDSDDTKSVASSSSSCSCNTSSYMSTTSSISTTSSSSYLSTDNSESTNSTKTKKTLKRERVIRKLERYH